MVPFRPSRFLSPAVAARFGLWVAPLLVLAIGWSVCALTFYAAWRRAQAQDSDRFARFAVSAEGAIKQRLDTYTEALEAGAGFMRASGQVTRASWHEFTAALDILGRYPGVRGIGVIYPVPLGETAAFERQIRMEGGPSFTIHAPPSADRASDDRAVIAYLEPERSNEPALGLDVLRERNRRDAALDSRDSGQPRLTRRIALVQDGSQRPGSMLFMPVYRAGTHPQTVAERRAAHVGWIYTPFVLEELLDRALVGRTGRLRLQLFEGDAPRREMLLYDTGRQRPFDGAFERIASLALAGQTYTVAWTRGPDFAQSVLAPIGPIAWTAGSGALATVFLAGLVYSLQRTGRQARRLADELTRGMAATQRELEAALRLQRAVLDGTVHSVISTTADGTITIFNAGAEKMLGYSRDEIVGRETPLRFHVRRELEIRAEDLSGQLGRRIAPTFEALTTRARLGAVDEREWTFIRRDGSRLPVLLSVTALHDDAGNVAGFVAIGQDLTDRKKAEISIRATEERLARVLGHAECLVWEAKVQLSGTDWSWRMAVFPSGLYHRLLGEREPNQEAGLWYQFKIPEQAEMNRRSREAMLHGLPGYVQEFRLLRGDETIWLRESVAITDEGGGHYWLIGVAIEITDQKRVEAALLASERRLSDVVRSMAEGLLLVRADGAVVECNDAASRILGQPRSRIVSSTLRQPRWTLITERGEPLSAGQYPAAITLATGEAQRDVVAGLRWSDGTLRWISINTEPVFDDDGAMRAVVASFTDITEKKRAEATTAQTQQLLHTITSILPGLVAYWTADLRCAFSNGAYLEWFGKSAEQMRGIRLPELLGEALFRANEPFVRGVLEGRPQQFERELTRPDGTVRHTWAQYIPDFEPDQKTVRGFVVLISDITARKQLEQSLAIARDEALDASRMKSEFLATMSHEIRTPMNAIIGMTSVLADTSLSREQADMLRIVSVAAESLMTIINDILDFSRIEAGELRLNLVELDVARIVDETVTLLSPQALAKGLEIHVDFDPAPGTYLYGDGGRVRQVLLNLLGNAIKFTDAGEVVVAGGVLRETEDRTTVRIEVRDTGIGIAPEARQRLFRPFVQIDGSATRRFGGTGLGLAITRQLVTAMGGVLDFSSEVGRGSAFWVELELPKRNAIPDYRLPQQLSGRELLVVEPSPTTREILQRRLAQHAAVVDTENNGAAALARMRNRSGHEYDAVVVAGTLPDMSGVDLGLEMRADRRLASVPIVVLATITATDVATVQALGAAVPIARPARAATVAAAIARLLTHAELDRQRSPAEPMALAAKPLRILIVEDNLANRQVASLLLAKLGHTVECAVDGQQALERLATADFDVILMDCQMPLLDGYETTRRIRSGEVAGIRANTPIVALTAYARPEDRARCLSVGMDGYVSKPVRVAELADALNGVAVTRGPDCYERVMIPQLKQLGVDPSASSGQA